MGFELSVNIIFSLNGVEMRPFFTLESLFMENERGKSQRLEGFDPPVSPLLDILEMYIIVPLILLL